MPVVLESSIHLIIFNIFSPDVLIKQKLFAFEKWNKHCIYLKDSESLSLDILFRKTFEIGWVSLVM